MMDVNATLETMNHKEPEPVKWWLKPVKTVKPVGRPPTLRREDLRAKIEPVVHLPTAEAAAVLGVDVRVYRDWRLKSGLKERPPGRKPGPAGVPDEAILALAHLTHAEAAAQLGLHRLHYGQRLRRALAAKNQEGEDHEGE